MEWTQNLVVFAAFCVVVTLLVSKGHARGAPRILLFVMAGGLMLLLGEEMSWGQHIFAWGTPDWLAQVNLQGETNFHNLGGWEKERVLRIALMIATPLAAGVLPIWAAITGRAPFGMPQWMIVPAIAAPWSLCFLVVGVAMKGAPGYPNGTGLTLFQYTEIQELCLYTLGLIYVWGLAAAPESFLSAGERVQQDEGYASA